jgi:hypothetical protein
MPKQVTLVEVPELLRYAESIGISWNAAHDILVRAGIPPMYESNSREIDFWDFVGDESDDQGPYGYKDEVLRIMVGFMVKENLGDFTLVND